jgi:hypothetical protein
LLVTETVVSSSTVTWAELVMEAIPMKAPVVASDMAAANLIKQTIKGVCNFFAKTHPHYDCLSSALIHTLSCAVECRFPPPLLLLIQLISGLEFLSWEQEWSIYVSGCLQELKKAQHHPPPRISAS